MIAPLLDREADELERALRAGPVQAARDLPANEATQLAEVLVGFGAQAEVRNAGEPTSKPPNLSRGTQPFDANVLRASLAEGERARSNGPRDSLPTPPVPSLPPTSAAIGSRVSVDRTTPPVASIPPPFEVGVLTTVDTPSIPAPLVTSEPTQITLLDDELIQAALASVELEEQEPRSRPEAKSRPGSGVRPPDNSGVRSGVRPEANSGVRPEANSGVRPEANSGVRPEANSGVRPEANSGVRPEANSGVRPQRAVIQSAPAPRTPARGSAAAAAAQRPAEAPPSNPGAPSTAPSATGPNRAINAIITTGETPALKGKMALPKSLQSRDDLPPWFPKMAMRPEPPPRRSPWPLILFVSGLVALVAAVLVVVLNR